VRQIFVKQQAIQQFLSFSLPKFRFAKFWEEKRSLVNLTPVTNFLFPANHRIDFSSKNQFCGRETKNPLLGGHKDKPKTDAYLRRFFIGFLFNIFSGG
jgi:hypothetical protein